MERIVARWTDWQGRGLEHLVLQLGSEAIVADAVVVSDDDAADPPFAVHYRITCDLEWRVRRAEVDLVGDDRQLRLSSDGQGHWLDAAGKPLAALDGAIDIDLAASPFTNTLPIRRLGLRRGQSADIRAAYIRVPELDVTSDPQRYTCLEPLASYRYASLDSDFSRDIETDRHGLVISYPGLFRRVV